MSKSVAKTHSGRKTRGRIIREDCVVGGGYICNI